MCKEDLAQVTEIDREAFPTQPAADYRHELGNRLARYVVVCDEVVRDESEEVEEPGIEAVQKRGLSGLASRLNRFFGITRTGGDESGTANRQYIFGFAGLWILADEAHVTNIAVREKHRQRGIGELLLISLIDLARDMKTQAVTLEVRASNIAAQELYAKYGFTGVGLRRGYYTDNREDALLMSLQDVASAPVLANLQRLREAYARRWGFAPDRLPDRR